MNTSPSPDESRFCWDETRGRLQAMAAVDLTMANRSSNDVADTLARRARDLARKSDESLLPSEALEIVTFSLGTERYAVEAPYVREIIRDCPITPIPLIPAHVRGVVNLRGEVLAVFDLRCLFDMAGADDQRTWIIVMGRDRPEFGIVADFVDEVTRLRVDHLRHAPSSSETGDQELIHGITPESITVLNTEVLMSDTKLFVRQARAGGETPDAKQ